jgi:hypothetical protein
MEDYNEDDADIELLLKRSEIENPWFTVDNQKFALNNGQIFLLKKI